ncbi:2-methylbutanal oxime monooxygenase [Jatropha curcas]|uniref:2-methylbutanal oxime monooxygenase n=1 Tax=Jatropha curcas TaxID=180498 RepID=UPI001892E472|nr:2-methylbutanal oxime monooxygenase [Jatropha curcas]
MSPRRCKSGLVTAPLRSTLMQKAVAGSCDRNSPSSLFLRSRQQRHNSMPSSPPQTTLDLTVSVPGLRFRRVRLSSMDWQQHESNGVKSAQFRASSIFRPPCTAAGGSGPATLRRGPEGQNIPLFKLITESSLDSQLKILERHLDPNRPKPEHEDIVDVLVGLMRDQGASFQLTKDHLKSILMDIFVGGIDTSSVTTAWAFTEILKNPRIIKKVQEEIRGIVGPNKNRVEGRDLDKFKYLELIVRETFRIHPPVPLLIPHFCTKECKIGGYDILPGTTVFINTYALGREPSKWENPEEFYPERFENSDVDYRGSYFELVPFGAGRRICPGLAMGTTAVKYTLANLLYGFDFELPNGKKFEAGAGKKNLSLVWQMGNSQAG